MRAAINLNSPVVSTVAFMSGCGLLASAAEVCLLCPSSCCCASACGAQSMVVGIPLILIWHTRERARRSGTWTLDQKLVHRALCNLCAQTTERRCGTATCGQGVAVWTCSPYEIRSYFQRIWSGRLAIGRSAGGELADNFIPITRGAHPTQPVRAVTLST